MRDFDVEVLVSVITRANGGKSFFTVVRTDCDAGLIMVAFHGLVCVTLFTPSLAGKASVRVSKHKNKVTEALIMSAYRQTMYPEINGSCVIV
jgi:hypothetical protein